MDCTQSTLSHQAASRSHRGGNVDVTVIGAGPSGALLAYLLALQGFQVVVVEKERLPRVKPCGGGLNQKTVDLIPFSLDGVVERVVSRLTFTQRLRQAFARTYSEPLVSLVTRCHFDHLIVERAADAGAHVYEACRVTELEERERSIQVRTSDRQWESRYLAFADGAKGTARRLLGFAATSPHDIGLDMDVEVPSTCPWTPDTLYIDWGGRPQGYAWAFPKADHWSIGVKGPASQSRQLKLYLRQFMERWGLQPPQGKWPYLAHMLPTRTPDVPLVQGRALVLGDAAGLLEPFTGEGIYYAVRSAHLAADALLRASVNDASPQAYAAAVESELMPELRGARLLQRLFDRHPWWFHQGVRLHHRSWRALAKILRGDRGFADVERVLARYPRLVQAALWPER